MLPHFTIFRWLAILDKLLIDVLNLSSFIKISSYKVSPTASLKSLRLIWSSGSDWPCCDFSWGPLPLNVQESTFYVTSLMFGHICYFCTHCFMSSSTWGACLVLIKLVFTLCQACVRVYYWYYLWTNLSWMLTEHYELCYVKLFLQMTSTL